MAIAYRKLSTAESKLYRAIRLESLQAHPESFGSTFQEQSTLPRLMFERAIEQADEGRFVIGAFDQGRLIGICGFVLAGSDSDALPDTGTIIQTYVRPSHSGRKIGIHLTRAVIREAFNSPTVQKLILDVKKGNLPALRVYQQAGFQIHEEPDEKTEGAYDRSYQMILYRDAWR
jgi:RimJ/RimL family protein N-acetyltransferase